MFTRTRNASWPGVKLDGSETFAVDLRDSVMPLVSAGSTDVSVIRADTNSHVFDYQGNLVNVAANEHRIMGARHVSEGVWSRYQESGQAINPDTCQGVMVEQAKQNEFLYFDDIDNAYWVQTTKEAVSATGTSIAGRAAKGLIGPIGTGIKATSKALTGNANSIHQMSALVKAGSTNFVWFRMFDTINTVIGTVWFNLATGAVGISTVVGAVIIGDYTIRKVNDGYWCTLSCHFTAATTSLIFIYGAANADASTDATGDGVNPNYWICSMQAITNLDADDTWFPQMPILDTEGAVSIRNDELIEWDYQNYSEVGSLSGEFYLPYDADAYTAQSLHPISLFTFQEYNNDTDNSMRVHIHNTGTLQFVTWPDEGTSFATLLETAAPLTKGWHRFAAAWEMGSHRFFVDGADANNVFFGFDGHIPAKATAVNRFYCGSRNSQEGGNHQDQYAHVPFSYMKKYDTKLSDAELIALSR